MKNIRKFILSVITVLSILNAKAQTADEIINKYLENIGGKDKWESVTSVKMTGKAKAQGMEIPATFLQATGGKQKISISVQGMEITQQAFDGNTAWATNFMTMKAEKMEAEDSENMKKSAGDFPDPFIDYAKKGYKVELEGKEKVEGTECFKIKLIKKPEIVEGKEVENVVYYFFDTQNYVPIVVKNTIKKGQFKGATQDMVFSDYQEVNGLFFPFSMTVKINGQAAQSVTFEKIEVNVPVEDKDFALPAGN
ncbi:MAG: hypothetical protein OHK0057_33380 [Thermoflexibacter sp.]